MITHEESLENFCEQFEFAIKNYFPHGFNLSEFSNIVLGGLGGSGIGAQVAKTYFLDSFPVPIEVVSDYVLPAYVNEKSLLILNSYSGNTEETIQMFENALEKGCKMLLISSGGKLKELGIQKGVSLYPIPPGFQPRMTIGTSLTYLFLIFGEINRVDLTSEITDVISFFKSSFDQQFNSAEKIFAKFKNTLKNKFVIVADGPLAPVALRFAQQINENCKLECFINIIPEANHNVIESFVGKMDTNFILLHTNRNERVTARFDFLTSHLEVENNKVLNMYIPEYSILTIFDVIYRLDWVTVLIANHIGAPLMKVPIITELKEFLNNLEIIE